jgi:hypothetical protein
MTKQTKDGNRKSEQWVTAWILAFVRATATSEHCQLSDFRQSQQVEVHKWRCGQSNKAVDQEQRVRNKASQRSEHLSTSF